MSNNTILRTFKYRTQESALLDLLEECVYFAKPSEFNETNDMQEGKFEMLSHKYLWTTILNAINKIERKRTGEIFIHPDIYPESDKNWITMPEDMFISQSKNVGICSTSKNYNNPVMWAHYCKNKGVCFELEWDDKIIKELNILIKDVTYSNLPRKINRDVILKNLIINYSIENPKANFKEILEWTLSSECSTKWIQNFVLESVCKKQESWSYENEIRLLSPGSGSFYILKRILRSVYMFLPQFDSLDFIQEFNKSRLLRAIFGQLLENYSNIKLFGLTYDTTGKLIKEEISLL